MANPLDPLEVLRQARSTSLRIQELIAKTTLPPEQRKALVNGVSSLMLPGEQLQAMIDLADAFGPPQRQIEEIQKTLEAQRAQLEEMMEQLTRAEEGIARLAASAEQIAELQKPYRKLLQTMQGSGGRDRSPDADPAD